MTCGRQHQVRKNRESHRRRVRISSTTQGDDHPVDRPVFPVANYSTRTPPPSGQRATQLWTADMAVVEVRGHLQQHQRTVKVINKGVLSLSCAEWNEVVYLP